MLAPVAAASPLGEADDAITAAWKDAGGDHSDLGAKQGDCYAAGQGFAQDFVHGKMFFTPATGAKSMSGAVLDKYEALGGPAASDLGFPTINEVPGLAGPDSRVSTFSASDKPVIFWTAEHGAFVVRGAINAAWDKLGSSGGVLGVPVGDETYDGEVATQAFSGGQVSWNRLTKAFATVPPDLANQLTDLQVPIDPTAAINMAWRAAGGPSGPLGAKQGDQYSVGGDGLAQNFAGGKIFFSPATGANAVESDILAKYESLGGPGGKPRLPDRQRGRRRPQAGQPGERVRRRRQAGDLLDARPRRVCGPRRDQGRVGQARRSDRQTGRAGGRSDGEQRRDRAEVHRWSDLVESGEEHVQHPAGELGVGTVRAAGAGAEDAGRFGVDRRRGRLAELASVVVAGCGRGGGAADRVRRAGGLGKASTPRSQA